MTSLSLPLVGGRGTDKDVTFFLVKDYRSFILTDKLRKQIKKINDMN